MKIGTKQTLLFIGDSITDCGRSRQNLDYLNADAHSAGPRFLGRWFVGLWGCGLWFVGLNRQTIFLKTLARRNARQRLNH